MAGASIKIGANSSEFQKQMKEVKSQLNLVSSECNLAAERAKAFGSATDGLVAQQKKLQAQLQAQNQIVNLYKERIANINSEIDKHKTRQTELSGKIEDVNKKYKESVEQTGKNSEESKKLAKELQGLKDEYGRNEKALESKNTTLTNTTAKLNDAERELVKNQKALSDINTEIKNINLDKLEKGFSNVSDATGKASDALKPISTAIGGIGIASAKLSIDFESSMAKVMTIADSTVVSYDDMKKAIIDLSNETGISADSIADDVYNAISAGQSTADAVNFVRESSKLAKAGFAESGQSLDVLTTIMNSYGLEASKVGEVSDTLVQIQNKGKTTVAELSSSMGKIIPTANSMGVELDQLGAGYALMTSKGIATAETTTYMNSLLNELGKSGTKASEALKKGTGKTFQELTQAGVPLGDVLVMLEQEGSKSGKSLSDMFGSAEAGKAALVLASENGDAFNKMLEEMGGSAGATNTAFEIINDTTKNKFAVSLNQLKNSGINLGDTLAPVISIVAEKVGELTSYLSSLDQEQLQTIATIGAGVIAFNIALSGISKLTGGISAGIKAYKDIAEFGGKAIDVVKNFGSKAIDGAKAAGDFALSLGKSAIEFGKNAIQAGIATVQSIAHKAATIASTIATNVMAGAQAALNFVMSLNPITLIIIAIVALVAAIIVLWNKCEWFRNMVAVMFEALKKAFSATIDFFKGVWSGFVAIWDYVINGIKTGWQNFCEFLTNVWNGVVNGVKSAWNGITAPFKAVIDAIGNIWQGIKSLFKLPRFTIEGSLNPLKWLSEGMPKIGVQWYYNGAIFKKPTVLGDIGVGDAFRGQGSNAEAIVPLNELYRNVKDIIDTSNSGDVVIYLTNQTEIDGEIISEKTTKKVIKNIGEVKKSRNIMKGRGKLQYV